MWLVRAGRPVGGSEKGNEDVQLVRGAAHGAGRRRVRLPWEVFPRKLDAEDRDECGGLAEHCCSEGGGVLWHEGVEECSVHISCQSERWPRSYIVA